MKPEEILNACGHHDLAPANNHYADDGAPCWECAHEAIAEARRGAIEAAARVADKHARSLVHAIGNEGLSRAPTHGLENMRFTAQTIASAIRALKVGP